jgi:hypothetical protein
VNVVVVKSRYRQPFGTFTGHLRDARGREARLERTGGVREDHDALW